jgi:hypothetical protein
MCFNHGRAAASGTAVVFAGPEIVASMNAATLPLPGSRDWPMRLRLPLSLTASIVVHAALLVAAAIVLRAMPATVGNDSPATALSASIVVQTPIVFDDALMQPITPAEPLQTMLPAPVAPQPRMTPLPGVSATPATIQVVADFIPVGRISYGVSDGTRLFGAGMRAQMATRFTDIPARAPRLNGTLSVLYPTKGAMAGRSLALSALLLIDEHGKISEARVLPEDPVFIAAVLAALKNSRFYPAEFDGKPISYWTVLDFNFTIDGPTGPDGKRLDR